MRSLSRITASLSRRTALRRRGFSRLLLVGARTGQDVRDAVVRLVAGELEDRAVGLLQVVQHRPRTRPRVRILDRVAVLDLIVRGAREALGDLDVLGGRRTAAPAADGIAPVEVGRLDDERLAFPAAARHADPALHAGGRLRPAVARDDARVV